MRGPLRPLRGHLPKRGRTRLLLPPLWGRCPKGGGGLAAVAFLALTAAAPELPTPMPQRLATVGALDKRSGVAREFPLHPGETARFGALTLHLRACEASQAWETPEAGGFVQIDQDLKKGGARRVFSGWLFAHSPALNQWEDPNYDVWVKACTMRFPDTGPDTVSAGSSAPDKSIGAVSKAKKSPRAPIAPDNNAR